ncbi:predicted protein [Plenodomus lingam JN3]|uniref:Predicted protein n=1 Tax=Leptosphaeria maculans (strain JN3 / isolate v23.1.3 / race Av1-4-5-6-7-8) TaxID=985895 RepID=E4ZX56_LEPMJ|nr:predicted protein [Plenodomus lingam JN3]CBX95266.1 predicted protein [Plenodomus lingam JN3]
MPCTTSAQATLCKGNTRKHVQNQQLPPSVPAPSSAAHVDRSGNSRLTRRSSSLAPELPVGLWRFALIGLDAFQALALMRHF